MCSSHVAAWAPLSHACRVLGLQHCGLDMPVVTPAVFQGCHVVSYARLFAGCPFPYCHHVTARARLLAGFLCPTAAIWRPVHATCRVLDPPSNGIVAMPTVSLDSPVGAHPIAQGRHTSVGVCLFPCLQRSSDTMCCTGAFVHQHPE